MIQFKNVQKKYPDGTLAIQDLNLAIEQGEFISIIGRSGAGKSTLLRMINATIPISSGSLEVFNIPLNVNAKGQLQACRHDIRSIRRQTGFVFQQFNLIKTHTVLSNVLMGRLGYVSTWRGVFGLFSHHDKEHAIQTLEEVGLKDKIHKRVDQLSGGQQQRVAIARALVQDPKIILADEPIASLDPKLSEIVLDTLYQINQSKKITILVNVHVLDHARRRATRILGLNKGRLLFDGKPDELTVEKVNLVYGN